MNDSTVESWYSNYGTMPVPEGTLVDVVYRNGEVNLGVHAGWVVDTKGSLFGFNAYDWTMDENDYDILKWRLAQPEQPTIEKISSDIKQANIDTLCSKILELDKLNAEVLALAKGMLQ